MRFEDPPERITAAIMANLRTSTSGEVVQSQAWRFPLPARRVLAGLPASYFHSLAPTSLSRVIATFVL